MKKHPLLVFILIIGLLYLIFTVVIDAKAEQPFLSCAQAKASGHSNIPETDDHYNPQLDRDHDGIACE